MGLHDDDFEAVIDAVAVTADGIPLGHDVPWYPYRLDLPRDRAAEDIAGTIRRGHPDNPVYMLVIEGRWGPVNVGIMGNGPHALAVATYICDLHNSRLAALGKLPPALPPGGDE